MASTEFRNAYGVRALPHRPEGRSPTRNSMESTGLAGLDALSFNVADTGRCSCCGNIAEVFDIDLMGLYRSFGFSDSDIQDHDLPRIRLRFHQFVSLEEVGKAISEALKKR